MKIDYKELLRKYIEYVDMVHGSDLINQTPLHLVNNKFTKDEWKELNKLAQ